MKRRIIMSVFVIAALTGGALSGMAQAARLYDELPREGCGPEGESPDEGFVGRMTKVLGLNDGQKEKIAAILKGVREKDTLLHQNLAETRKQLRSATQAASFDEAAIRALATKKGQLETDLIVSRAKVRSQINALLTPEQRAIAAKLHQGPPRKPEPGPCFDRDRRPPRPCGDEEGRPGPSFDGEWEFARAVSSAMCLRRRLLPAPPSQRDHSLLRGLGARNGAKNERDEHSHCR